MLKPDIAVLSNYWCSKSTCINHVLQNNGYIKHLPEQGNSTPTTYGTLIQNYSGKIIVEYLVQKTAVLAE